MSTFRSLFIVACSFARSACSLGSVAMFRIARGGVRDQKGHNMRRVLVVFALVVLTGCAHRVPLHGPSGATIEVPRAVASALELVGPDDKDYAAADATGATGKVGDGKGSTPYVVRLTHDLPVYRLWAGPAVRDAQGRTSRIGQWWTFDRPSGTLAGFRRRYEVCVQWDTLQWVAQCTIRRGAVVVIGPGQSVSAHTCGDPTARESYPANDRDWQVYIHEAWNRTSTPNGDLSCPDERRDYQDDPGNIAKPIKTSVH